MKETSSLNAWLTGHCPYGFICEKPSECMGIEFTVPSEVGQQFADKNFDEKFSYVPRSPRLDEAGRKLSLIHVCAQASQDPSIMSQLDALKLADIPDII